MAEKEYIEREDLIDKTSDIRVNGNPYRVIFYDDVILAPAADVVPVKHGHWIYNPNRMDFGLGAWQCSICGIKNDNLPYDKTINPYNYVGSKYCPNCGAKMDEKRRK